MSDYVWIMMKNWKTNQLNKKLNNQMTGKYKIIEKVDNFYWLNLPESIKICLIFLSDKLQKTATDSFSE